MRAEVDVDARVFIFDFSCLSFSLLVHHFLLIKTHTLSNFVTWGDQNHERAGG